MSEKVGVFNRLGFAASGGTTATSEFEFLEGSTIGVNETFIDAGAIWGSRSHQSERTRRGPRRVDGVINMAPNAAELATILQYILGGAPSGTSYPLAETIPDFVLFPVRDGAIYTATPVYIDKATLSASAGGPMNLSLTVIGADETLAGSMGSAAVDVSTGGPFVLMDSVMTVAGSARAIESFELSIDNHLEVKYRNSITPSSIRATDRTVALNLPISLGIDSALYGSALAGVAATLVLTNGTVSLSLSMAALQAPKSPLPFGQRGVMDFPWQAIARKSGATAELVTVLDSTP